MEIEIFQVDSFTNKPFSGNPAGVCILEEEASEKWMQNVAAEMNLSETAFVYPNKKDIFTLRWFTPVAEVDLCGHATLAAAHIMWEKDCLKSDQNAKFMTKSGLLTCSKFKNQIEMDFPVEEADQTEIPENLIKALNVAPLYVGRNRFDYLVEIDSEERLGELKPDFGLLKQIDMRGIIVTSKSNNNNYDFVSRFFAPSIGIDEDPVTGSAHCCLTPYWAKKLGKKELNACQISKRRGELSVRLENDRVFIKGEAVTVINGKISV